MPDPENRETPAEAAAPEAPATAATVAAGDADETHAAEIVRLQAALEAERGSRKRDQTRVAELEDEIHQLKQAFKPAAKADDDDWFSRL